MKKTNQLRKHLRTLTKAQLVALSTQKNVMSYSVALDSSREELAVALANVEGIMKAEPA